MKILHTISKADKTYTLSTDVRIVDIYTIVLTRIIGSSIESITLHRDYPISVSEVARLAKIDDGLFKLLSDEGE